MLFQLKSWAVFALTSALLAPTVIAGTVETYVRGTGTTNTPVNCESELIVVSKL